MQWGRCCREREVDLDGWTRFGEQFVGELKVVMVRLHDLSHPSPLVSGPRLRPGATGRLAGGLHDVCTRDATLEDSDRLELIEYVEETVVLLEPQLRVEDVRGNTTWAVIWILDELGGAEVA